MIEMAKECFKCGEEIFYWDVNYNQIEKRKIVRVELDQYSLNISGDIRYKISYKFSPSFPEETCKLVDSKYCGATIEDVLNKLKLTYKG